MKKLIYHWLIVASLVFSHQMTIAQAAPLIVKLNEPGAVIQPTMWGIFFEDINFAADGGLYAELIKNRSFEFAEPLMGWDIKRKQESDGNVLIINRGTAFNANPRFARITVTTDNSEFGLTNEGFRGIGIKKDSQYNFSMQVKMEEGASQQLLIRLLNEKGEVIGNGNLLVSGNTWKTYSTSLRATATAAKGSFRIEFKQKGITDIDMVSLFPQDTWKNRPAGLRKDLVQLLADMKPGFVRFPGGCIVEGRDLNNRYQWKKTTGDADQRQLIINRWNTEFKNRSAPDYFQSFGLGFYEYFLLSEDIGAEPLPILNCGMACQFNTAEVVPVDELDPYIQDALDLIEFANGTTGTRWGKFRAEMGHPAPFNLKMMGVGNEQWGPQYAERYKIFAQAIHEKYPAVKLVSSVGPFASGALFNYLDPVMRELKADLLDEHYYMPPEFFLKNVNRYNKYDRNSSKIFAGEYAAHIRGTEGVKRNTWQAALAEAAFMTGLERNADVVFMSSYAPLFAHVDAWQWAPDLIWFDNLNSYGTPSYYVQKLFSINKGTQVVPLLQNNTTIEGQDSLYATACMDKNSNELILKIVNTSSVYRPQEISFEGVKRPNKKAILTVLKSGDLNQVNSLNNPANIAPRPEVIDISGKKINLHIPPYSLTVLRLKML